MHRLLHTVLFVSMIVGCNTADSDEDDDDWNWQDPDTNTWAGPLDDDGDGSNGASQDDEQSGSDGNVYGGDTPDTGNPYDGPIATFEEALIAVLVPSCGFDSCHGSGAGYLRIHEYQTEDEWLSMRSSVLPSRLLIIPGDAGGSYLIQKMEDADTIAGEAMPPPNGGLSEYRIGLVRSWIDNIE